MLAVFLASVPLVQAEVKTRTVDYSHDGVNFKGHLACDMYGEGKVARRPEEAGQMAGDVCKNIKTWQGRAQPRN